MISAATLCPGAAAIHATANNTNAADVGLPHAKPRYVIAHSTPACRGGASMTLRPLARKRDAGFARAKSLRARRAAVSVCHDDDECPSRRAILVPPVHVGGLGTRVLRCNRSRPCQAAFAF